MSSTESTCWTIVRAAAAGSRADREELEATNESHDLNETVDSSSAPADSLDAALAAGSSVAPKAWAGRQACQDEVEVGTMRENAINGIKEE
jgi:hypothetical protein